MNPPYDVILADPPWRYEFSKSSSRQIENQYATMSDAQLVGEQMQQIVMALHNGNAILLHHLQSCRQLRRCRPQVAHDRHAEQLALTPELEPELPQGTGMGYYTRVRHEPLLIGTVGAFRPPAPSRRPRSAFYAERRAHSEKPELSYQRIEFMYPTAKRIELFARTRRPDWDAWGNEITP